MRMQILSGLPFYENILWFDQKVSEAEQMIFRVARLEPPSPPRGTEAAAALWIHRLGVWRILCWLLHRGFSEILGNCARDLKGPPDILKSRALCFLSRLEKVSTTLFTTAFWASSFDTDPSFVRRSVPTSRQKWARITRLSQIKWI